MELLQLRYFQVVATNQHITRSAEQLNISQPAISAVIARLEQELGAPLFDRSGRSIVLNQYGRVFLERVNRILLEVDNAKKEIREMCDEEDQTIRMAVTSPQFLQGVIDEFIGLHPQVKWWQRVDELPEIIKRVESGQIDLSVTSPGFISSNVESILLLRDEFVIAVHPEHHLAKCSSVSLADVAREKYIALQKGFPFRTQTDQLFADFGITPNIVMECDHYLRRELLNANAGITMSSLSAKYRHLYDDTIVYLPINDVQRSRDIVLTRQKGKYLTKVKQLFCDFLQNHYRNFGSQKEFRRGK
jgi:LysR family transcriptional activator of glutamate synthase operon